MNVESETEAAQFPEKEYINGIVLAVCVRKEPFTITKSAETLREEWKVL
jgi:hypothetical protein